MEGHLHQVHSDPKREESLAKMERIIQSTRRTVPFKEEEPSWQEVNDFIKKARGKSAPGPNGIPYKVYKCERLTSQLWKLLRVAWRKNFLAGDWLIADWIKQFCTISLLNVEAKIFFGILVKRLSTFMLANGYMDTSVQKGGVPGVSEALAVCHGVFLRLCGVSERVAQNSG